MESRSNNPIGGRGRGQGGGRGPVGGARGGRGRGGRGGPTNAAATRQPSAQQLGNRPTAAPASQGVGPTRPDQSAPLQGGDQHQRGGDISRDGSTHPPPPLTYAAAISQSLGDQHQRGGGISRDGSTHPPRPHTYAAAINQSLAQKPVTTGGYRPPSNQGVGPTRLESVGSSGTGGNSVGVGGAKPSGVSGRACAPTSVPDQRAPEPLPASVPSSPLGSTDENLVPMKRPDTGGKKASWTVQLLVNHFPVRFNPEGIILHYDMEIKSEVPPRGRSGKIPKTILRNVWDKLCSDVPTQFPLSKTSYDGEKNIFSIVRLPTEKFRVELSDGENTSIRSYNVTLKLVNGLDLCKLKDYLEKNLLSNPRDVLQGMDVVMRDNPSRHRISVGRSFYPRECNQEDDLGFGITASRGIQHSLKPTKQGLALVLDYSVMAFFKSLPVIDFLQKHIPEFSTSDFKNWREDVINVLGGLRVTVTHRVTKQKYFIAGLTDEIARNISFDVLDPEGSDPPKNVDLVGYFKEKYKKEIIHKDIPCLDLGNNKRNNVPMEFCILAEGQGYPKEALGDDVARNLKKISMASPQDRKKNICEMVRAVDGPCGGDALQNFDIQVSESMTPVEGRVFSPPKLRLRDSSGKLIVVNVDKYKCHWSLAGRSVFDGKSVERWALLDFSSTDFRCQLIPDSIIRKRRNNFIWNLRNKCGNLGICMEDPLVCRGMSAFSGVSELQQFLKKVIEEANGKCKGPLQMFVCVITQLKPMKPIFNYLKWISETKLGILTQCCLSTTANRGSHPDFVNIALKINAKLGGSNVELFNWLPPPLKSGDHVMFIGADVNHPGPQNRTSPSIAAVVATVNWPAANRYAARICPQENRKEKILKFGSMCLDLLRTYTELNNVKPQKIVVFRDGVGDDQSHMVLNEEFNDLKKAIYEKNYHPTITLVVAQKRHQTRLFLKSQGDGGSSSNVSPGTVVDTVIVHPFEYDFYLCSHYGPLGTSKVTHYRVLLDEHKFTSDQLQKLVYDLCFTVCRCTKPVSLVPPVYYADLVAYRGRMYQEVVKSLPNTSEATFDSFNEEFYKLHPDVKNTMFFI